MTASRDGLGVRLGVMLYRAFVRLLPRRLREDHGDELVADFRALVREARERTGLVGVLGAVLRGCLDVVARIPAELGREREVVKRAEQDLLGVRPRARTPRVRPAEAVSLWLKEAYRAARSLAARPGFTLTVIVTLGLGIGANVAIFAVVNAVLIEPLPYPESDRIVTIRHRAPGLSMQELESSGGMVRFYQSYSRTVSHIAVVRSQASNLIGGERPVRVDVASVTPEFFDVMRVGPMLGRRFVEEDADPGAPPVVILSYAGWQTHFGGDRSILGRVVEVDGVQAEVVGVMPKGFDFPGPEYAALLASGIDRDGPFGAFGVRSVARLAPGVALEDARSEIESLQARLPEMFPELTQDFFERAQWQVDVSRLRDVVVHDVQTALWVILVTVGFVLLIACANVANLFLVRSESRKRDLAIRTALGASRGRLAGSVLTESVLLGLAGGVAGMALATVAVRALVASEAARLPRLHEVGIDGTTLAFAGLISVLAGLGFGALPLPGLLSGRLDAALREARGGTGARERHRMRKVLIVGQVALALVLLTGSGLMLRSFQRLRAVDPGFRPENVLTLGISLGAGVDRTAAAETYLRLLDEVAALPGVEAAGVTGALPILSGTATGSSFQIESRPEAGEELPLVAMFGAISSGHFEALGVPLLEGRPVERRDDMTTSPAVWVNRTFAHRYLGDTPVGERIRFGPRQPWLEVAGVVGDVRGYGLAEYAQPMAYLPITTPMSEIQLGLMFLTVRTAGEPLALLPSVRATIERVAPEIPLTTARSMESVVKDSLKETSFLMAVLGAAALVALVLGAIGLYGVISYVASQRTREIGLRIALGAEPGRVRSMLVRQGLAVVAIGLLIGLGASFALTRLMAALLFEVSTTDPFAFAAAIAVLAAVSLLASYLPSWRASRIEPVAALRMD